MRIKCPYCGERDAQEFAYLGAADPKRPNPDAEGAADAFYDYVYLRENPAGVIAELWYHTAGCHSWLRVERDTRTHIIHDVAYASPHEAAD
jgi:heterotetrameric sarcosine oxidase delta subunit